MRIQDGCRVSNRRSRKSGSTPAAQPSKAERRRETKGCEDETCHGRFTFVIVKLDTGWKIAQLHLSAFPAERFGSARPEPRRTSMSKFCIAAFCAFLLPALTAHAEVTRFEVLQNGPAFEGRSFGSVGRYVKIMARATIAVDPSDPRNAVIADIDKAPRNEKGLVEATADVVLLRPADPLRANGTLLVDIPNRGTKLAPHLFDDAAMPGANDAEKASDAGIG
jgi:SnoaL-like domain